MLSSTLVSNFIVRLESIVGSVRKRLLVKAKLIQTRHTTRLHLSSYLQTSRWEYS